MSNVYDHWERLVGAVIRREQLWQMFHDRSPSVSSISSDFSFDSQVLDVPFDFSSRAGSSRYQLPAVENSQKNEKSVKEGSLVLEMRMKRRDAIQWMSYRLLPLTLRERIRSYDKYLLIRNLPKDLSKDIMRHICLAFLERVPMFEKIDEQLYLDATCDRLKSIRYTKDSYILHEDDPVDAMLFIVRGKLLSETTNQQRTGYFNSDNYISGGNFCGEELILWALDPNSSSNLPISTRNIIALSDVEVFALVADDLKFVVSQFIKLHRSKQMRLTHRFYSQQWRTWAACHIQFEWRHYYRKKLVQEENKLQDALAKALVQEGSKLQDLEKVILLQRPDEPDFAAEEKYYFKDYNWAAWAIQLAWRNYYRKKLIREEANKLQDAWSKARMLLEPAEPDFTTEEK